MKDFAAIDFETANGRPSSICSVGVIIVRDGKITERFHSLVRPYPNYYMDFTVRIHGITREDTDSQPKFPEVWSRVEPLIEGLPLVAHNSSFDEGCLRAAFATYGMEYPGYIFHCTLRASRRTLRLPCHRLPVVAGACGFDLTHHHDALADAEACAAIAIKIL